MESNDSYVYVRDFYVTKSLYDGTVRAEFVFFVLPNDISIEVPVDNNFNTVTGVNFKGGGKFVDSAETKVYKATRFVCSLGEVDICKKENFVHAIAMMFRTFLSINYPDQKIDLHGVLNKAKQVYDKHVCDPNNIPILSLYSQSSKTSNEFAKNASRLAEELPGYEKIIRHCPTSKSENDSCDRFLTCKRNLGDTVIHLNDYHKWTTDQIADWLQKLHDDGVVDLAFKGAENG